MSKVTRVTVLCPNGRQQAVNLTPNSSILQILEEVCEKQKVNPDEFDVCHYNKPLDLSLPVRFANLSNNAQLELRPTKAVRKDCLISIALQLETGERIMKDFVPSTSLWDVVEKCLNNKPGETNSDKKGEPVCIYMRQQLIGDALKETTLRGLGLTKGSAIIRLVYRNPEDLSDQAHISAPLSRPQKDSSPSISNIKFPTSTNEMECDSPNDKLEIVNMDSSTKVAVSPDKSAKEQVSSPVEENTNKTNEVNCGREVEIENIPTNDISVRKKETTSYAAEMPNEEKSTHIITEQKMDVDSNSSMVDDPVEEIGAIHYIGNRHAVLYSLNDVTEVKKADLPDEFFELTVDDVRYLMEEYKRTRVSMENQPLLTKELRNRHIQKKLGRFKKSVIRVYFPEKLVLQAVFEAQETVKDVCDFIRNYLEDRSLNFYLYTTPPKEKKDPSKTLIESMLIPAAVVYFGSEKQNTNYLMSSLKEKISDPRAAALAAYESRKEAICEDEEITDEIEDMPLGSTEPEIDFRLPGPSFNRPSGSIKTSEKVPKWLKMSKK